ncbi:helix-turn-helix domain-containing protein [Streptomyces mirabilis]|uniref:helix-turn-helix domain-containing protein n=1 Tax=Streptomyces mirabilis TaxID=68239 RepID=UPI00331A35C9
MNLTTTDPPEFLSVADAARRLGVSPRTVRRWYSARKISVIRQGRVVRIPASGVDALITPAVS